MPEGAIVVNARVLEGLPHALYRVELEDGSRGQVTAHAAAPGLLRILPGDGVVVELMSRDATRGRIVGKRS
jgi:translation initiation factor IF-1